MILYFIIEGMVHDGPDFTLTHYGMQNVSSIVKYFGVEKTSAGSDNRIFRPYLPTAHGRFIGCRHGLSVNVVTLYNRSEIYSDIAILI